MPLPFSVFSRPFLVGHPPNPGSIRIAYISTINVYVMAGYTFLCYTVKYRKNRLKSGSEKKGGLFARAYSLQGIIKGLGTLIE